MNENDKPRPPLNMDVVDNPINTEFINQHPDLRRSLPLWGVATALCQFAGKDGKCFPSHAAISERTGLSKSGVKNAIRKLRELHVIEVLHDFYEDGACKSNTYVILAPANKAMTDRLKINFHNRGAYDDGE